jgi:polar amino acid transport system permease protein
VYHWDFAALWEYRPLILSGILFTLIYTVVCVVLGIAVGLVVAVGRMSAHSWVRAPLRAYVELFRCTPVLVQLVWIYYALPIVSGIEMSATSAAVLALTLYGGSFYSEIIRGGIVSIDAGQSEAARALGMRRLQVMRRVVLPQAFVRMLPALMNQSIIQLKNTSLLSVLAVPDLLYQGQTIAHITYRPLEAYTMVAIAYFIVLLPATLLARHFEDRLGGAPVHE